MANRVKRFDEINITPLTDIFLVLLIIMMVVAPMLDSKGLSIALPSVSESVTEASKPAKVLDVDITAQNTISIEGKTIATDDLREVLRDQSATHPDGLSLNINPEARYELSVQVMDAAQAVGIEKLAINEG